MSELGDEAVIEVRVTRIEQLFESLDPSPFHERDLDPKAAEFILNWAGALPRDRKLVIRIHVAGSVAGRDGDVAAALHTDFAYRAEVARREVRETFAMGWRYLAVGVTVLALAVIGGQVVVTLFASPVAPVLREGLLILGWVANWKPFQTLLYDWQPPHRRRKLLLRLARARVELVEGTGKGEAQPAS